MGQLKGLWRDTKFVWIGFVLIIFVLAMLISWFYFSLMPFLPVCYAYFAYIRYDENGNEKVDLD